MDVQYNNNNNSNVRNNSLQNAMVTRTRRRRCDELDVIPMDRALLCMMLPRVMRLFPKNVNPKWILNVMHGLILWWSNCETPAMRAMNLQVVNQSSIDTNEDDGSLNNTNNSSKKDYKRLFWMILSILDFTSSGSSLLPASLPFVSSNNNIVARQRQEWMYQSVRKWISCFLPPLKLYIFLKCLSSQQHNSSASLAMTLGGLQYIPTTNTTATNTNESQQQQPINFVYAHRRYMYEELMELAYAMLPISRMGILPSALVALIKRIKTRIRNIIQSSSTSAPLPTTSCSICQKSPVTIPYQINCGHIHCYTCLRQALIECPNYKCHTCGQPVSSSQRIIL